MIKAIFFDAAGTLVHLNGSVGDHYALVGREVGVDMNPNELDRAFAAAWKKMPPRLAIDSPREDDDKGWWRDLVNHVLTDVTRLGELDRDNFFEVAYEHFAEPGVWALYPDVLPLLNAIPKDLKLAVVSNFDGRLRMILEQLGISKRFLRIFVSSEIGADKPDPEIFRRALKFMNLSPTDVLHVGDDPVRDWAAATAAGLSVFELRRPDNSLTDVLSLL